MKNTLKNLGYFSSYVANNPINSNETGGGALTIVSNSSGQNDVSLYVDTEFIASGFGFPNKSSYLAGINVIQSLRSEVDQINNILGSNQNNNTLKNTSLQYNYIDGDNDNNMFGQEYNNYGMPVSYNYLRLSQTESSTEVTYILSSNKRTSHNYITDIDVSITNDYYHISNAANGNITLTFKNTSQVGLQDYEVQYGQVGGTMTSIDLENISINGSKQYVKQFSFNPPGEIIEKDFSIQLIHNYMTNSYPVYSYIYPSLLKWKNYILYSSANSNNTHTSDYTAVNNFNLTDSSNYLSGTIAESFSNIINLNEFNIYYSYGEEIKLEFQNRTLLYDYIYLVEDADVEFYFNGIKSNNWHGGKIQKSVNGSQKTFWIYQSPQKYIGSHTWIIKINKKL